MSQVTTPTRGVKTRSPSVPTRCFSCRKPTPPDGKSGLLTCPACQAAIRERAVDHACAIMREISSEALIRLAGDAANEIARRLGSAAPQRVAVQAAPEFPSSFNVAIA